MKKITLEEFDLVSTHVKEKLEKTLNTLKNTPSPKVSETKDLDAYLQAKSNLQNIFSTHDDQLIIHELVNCLELSEKATLEIIKVFTDLADHQQNIDDLCNEAHNDDDFFQNIYVNSLEKYTDKLVNEKGKGGRSGADYRLYEKIIIEIINKYLDTPRREKYTIQKAIEEITRKIEAIDGTHRNISDSTFKAWKQNFENNGHTIYKTQ